MVIALTITSPTEYYSRTVKKRSTEKHLLLNQREASQDALKAQAMH